MHTPELTDDGQSAWNERIAGEFESAMRECLGDSGGHSPVRATPGDETTETRVIEWPAFPARAEASLGRRNALQLLDWFGRDGTPHGRIRHQDEYAEWRTVSDARGLRAIEFTTELPEYWETLAGHAPATALDLAADFAGVATLPTDAVYGQLDPYEAGVTPAERIQAFRAHMLAAGSGRQPRGPISDFNNGRKALCCMTHRSNTLAAMLRLVISAARPYLVRDQLTSRTRFPSGSEAILGINPAATAGRNSDPLIVERLVRFATEGRVIAPDDPVGIYICAVQHHELAQPDGKDIPAGWIDLSRDLTRHRGPTRPQRLRLAVPDDADFGLDELIVRRTGEPLRYGGQLAELVQLALHVRTTSAEDGDDVEPAEPRTEPIDYSIELGSWAEFRDQGPRVGHPAP